RTPRSRSKDTFVLVEAQRCRGEARQFGCLGDSISARPGLRRGHGLTVRLQPDSKVKPIFVIFPYTVANGRRRPSRPNRWPRRRLLTGRAVPHRRGPHPITVASGMGTTAAATDSATDHRTK